MHNKQANWEVIIGSVMISFSAIFVKLTTTGPTVDGFYRMLFGGIGLVIITLIRKENYRANWPSYAFATLAGVLFALDLTFWHQSIMHIGPGLATVIVNLQVFILGIIGFTLYGDLINWKYAFSIPIAMVGLYLLIGSQWQLRGADYHLGILQCGVAMVCYTAYIVSLRQSQQTQQPLTPIENLAVVSLVSSVILGCIAVYQGETFITKVPMDWLWLVLYGIFGQILGWLLITRGIPHISISRASFLLLLQPAFSFFWDILIFNRVTLTSEIVGAAITLLAIFLSNSSRAQIFSEEDSA